MYRFKPFAFILLLASTLSFSQNSAGYQPSSENLEAREWFQNAKFGLFIHWGVYSILGDGEWVMNNQNISIDNYNKLPRFFNPTAYNAEAWVQMAKNAGMKYITITSRHHDGFSMFDSEASDYNLVDQTPYGKDVLQQLAEACRKEDMKLFFYYSLLDWHRDDYYPRGRTGNGIDGRGTGNWEDYIAFMKAQLTELLTNYGDIAGIWFDGHWDQKEWDGKKFGKLKVDWHYEELYGLIHQLQPRCLVGNNHHLAPLEGEDFQMFEKDLPGQNTTGWGTSADAIGQLPLEVCETINGSWGFNLQDNQHKTVKELVHYLVRAAGYGSNLLLNVGPMPNGEIQPEHQKTLAQVGEWLRLYGETIYGTRKGPLSPNENMATTQKGKTIYVHWLNPSENIIFLKGKNIEVKEARLFQKGQKLKVETTAHGLVIAIPPSEMDAVDTVIQITLK